MKSTFKSLAVLTLSALAMVSCQKELLGPATQEGQEVAVSLDLTTPLMGTKAYADGNTVDVVHVHVYQHDASGNLTYIAPASSGATETPSKDVRMSNGAATYSTRLVTGQTYTFVFWAEKSGNGYYSYDSANKTVAVSYSNATGNDESRDAFYAVLPVTITGAYSARVPLKRPFAQINFGASDYDAAVAAGITVTGASVKLTGIANSINLLDGTVSGSDEVTFVNTALPSDPNATLRVASVDYKYVAMDYVLVGKDRKTLSDVTLTLAADGTLSTEPVYTYSNVPLQGNYRTNIVGNLFTSPADIIITVDPAFGNPDENIVVQNVATISAANEALRNGATSVTISNVTSSEAGRNTLQMPATSKNITVTVENIESTANLQIVKPTTGENPESVSVVLPASASVSNLTIDLPQSHVEVNGATYSSLTATTSNNTLVIGSDVTVTTLTINAGSAIIYGNVTTLVKGENAGKIEWHVTDQASLKTALKYDGKIVIESDIAMETSADINGGRTLEIDLNGHNISAPSRVLNISNAKVDFTGEGKIYESTDNQYGALVLAGSSADVADYTVVNVGENVTLAGWTGIFISKDASGESYNNYGLVVNCKGTLENPGMDTHTTSGDAIYINGSNKNTTGNIPKINLDGCRLKSKGLGIYAAGYAEWTLSNCEVEGDITAIEIRAGKMTVNGGTYTSNANPFEVEPNGNGTTTEGAALGISQHTSNLPIEVVVNGGTFNGAYAIWEKDVQDDKARDKIKLTVNDGTFNGAIYSQNNKDFLKGGTYDDVSALDYMGKYNGDINITMARDGSICTSDFYQNRGGATTSTITIDGAGHNLTFHSTYRNHVQTTNGAKIILKNATVDSDYKVEGSTWDDYGLIFQCPTEFENVTFNRQLVLEQPYVHKLTNVIINQTSATGDMYALWIEAGADVTFNGGTVNSINPNGSLNRAIKIADEYITDPQLTKLNVSGVTFKSQKKAAVLVTSTAGANIVWGEGNNISQVAADQTNAVWNDADRTAAWELVTVTGCTKFQEQ